MADNISFTNDVHPYKWTEWQKTSNSDPESPNLELLDPTFLPPRTVTLVSEDPAALFAGEYRLDLQVDWNSHPQYDGPQQPGLGSILYFNGDLWVLGDTIHADYVFKLSNSREVSPAKWTESTPAWINNGSKERPMLSLTDQSALPPSSFEFVPYSVSAPN